jgi:hypothetical protein
MMTVPSTIMQTVNSIKIKIRDEDVCQVADGLGHTAPQSRVWLSEKSLAQSNKNQPIELGHAF